MTPRSGALLITTVALAGCASLGARPGPGVEFWGFTAPWDARSTASVAQHGSELAAVVSGLIVLDSASFRPVSPFRDTLAPKNVGNRRYMTLVTTYQGDRFHPETIRGLAEDSLALARTASAVAIAAGDAGYRGAILDFEELTPVDFEALIHVTRVIADSIRAHGVAPIAMAIPAMDTAAYPARPLLSVVDLLVVMLYDQHWRTSPPGPIAAPSWASRALAMRVGEVGASKLIAAFPTYGYRWIRDSATVIISYDDAVRSAQQAYVPLARDPASSTLHAESPRWSEWVSDAVLLDTLMRGARTLRVSKFALWRLGLEDPRVWSVVTQP